MQAFAAPQEASTAEGEEEQTGGGGFGNFVKKAGKFINDNKGAALTALGLEEGKEEEGLTKLLQGWNIDPTVITNVTSSFTGQEGVTSLIKSFTNPEKLTTMLTEKTGMDSETITGFVDTVKAKFK